MGGYHDLFDRCCDEKGKWLTVCKTQVLTGNSSALFSLISLRKVSKKSKNNVK